MNKIVITCPRNMSDKTYEYICSGFRKRLGNDLTFERVISDRLIGGFTAAVNGRFYDMSVNTQLDEMKKHMSEESEASV